MKSSLVTIALGLLFAGTSASHPSVRVRSEKQHILEKPSAGLYDPTAVNDCIPRDKKDLPGVGFDLGVSYATVAIKYENGTVIDVAKINPGAEYQTLMHDLSQPGEPYGPPFSDPFDSWKWQYRRALRSLRTARGLPSTPQIGILSNTLTTLSTLASTHLPTPVTHAVASIPHLPRLAPGGLEAAFQFSSLKKTESPKYFPINLNVIDAAYAGTGQGLCTHWDNFSLCDTEEDAIPEKYILTLSFTSDALTLSTTLLSDAYHSSTAFYHRNEALGLRNLYLREDFWDKVKEEIVEGGVKGNKKAFRVIDDVLVMGEFAEETGFLNVLWKALGDLEEQGVIRGRATDMYARNIQKSDFNALYVGARGAAELSRRWAVEKWGKGSDFCGSKSGTVPVEDFRIPVVEEALSRMDKEKEVPSQDVPLPPGGLEGLETKPVEDGASDKIQKESTETDEENSTAKDSAPESSRPDLNGSLPPLPTSTSEAESSPSTSTLSRFIYHSIAWTTPSGQIKTRTDAELEEWNLDNEKTDRLIEEMKGFSGEWPFWIEVVTQEGKKREIIGYIVTGEDDELYEGVPLHATD